LGSSGITGERIWRERAEDRQVDCLGRQPVAEDVPKLANVTSPDEQREVRYAARRLARVLVDHECPRRLSNHVSNLLTADLAGNVRSSSSREPPQERSAWALIRRIGIFDDVRRALRGRGRLNSVSDHNAKLDTARHPRETGLERQAPGADRFPHAVVIRERLPEANGQWSITD
jgi:hypothetical protein